MKAELNAQKEYCLKSGEMEIGWLNEQMGNELLNAKLEAVVQDAERDFLLLQKVKFLRDILELLPADHCFCHSESRVFAERTACKHLDTLHTND